MTFRLPSFAVLAVLGTLGAIVWTGCGPGSETRYFCDATGCQQCDAYGCSVIAAPTKTPCTGNVSCPPGSVCTSNGCSVTCSDDAPCPRGEVCKSGICTPPASDPGTKKECTTKSDCTDGKACIGGKCAACGGSNGPCPCTATSDCASGQECAGSVCTSPTNTCTFSSECGVDQICADGQCLASCATTACAAGFVCNKGACEPAPSTSCTDDTQCSGDTPKCAGGSCVKPCSGDPECGSGKFCDQGACVVDTRPKPNCTDDTQCGGTGATPKKCLDGFCKYTCQNDAYCKTIDTRIGFCAKDGVCRTDAEAHAECLKPEDCSGGAACVDNKCK